MNSRRYPRSTMQAFPHTAEYGAAIERPSRGHRVAYWTMAFAVVYLAGLLIWDVL